MTRALRVGVLAPLVLAGLAGAQVDDLHVPRAVPVTVDQIRGGDYSRVRYGPRADEDVYAVGWADQTGGGVAGPATAATVYDDVTFGGSCSSTLPISLNGMAFGIWEPATPMPDHVYMKISFFPNHDNTVPATAAPFSGTPVVANLDLGGGWSGCPGCGVFFHDSVLFNFTFAVLDASNVFDAGAADRTCGVLQELYADAAYTTRLDGFGIMRRANTTSYLVGSSDTFSWFDQSNPNTGTILNDSTHRTGGGALGTGSRATFLDLQATNCQAAGFECIQGCLADGTTTLQGVLLPDQVMWCTLCLNQDATDSTLRFLDIDTEGSVADVALAVYSNAGELGANSADYDSGSGTNAQLSFGIGRRAAVGDGAQYDGRNYFDVPGLLAGVYYFAIAPNGSTFGPTGWAVNGNGPGGAYSLHLRTNVNAGGLDPSVPPALATADDFSAAPLVSPGVQIVSAAAGPFAVRWVKFTTCSPLSGANPGSIDMIGSTAPGSGLELFDSAGNLVAQARNASGLCSLSFTATPLPAGTYYLAMNAYGAQLAPDPSANGRWHVRSTDTAGGFTLAGHINVSNSGCTCCNPDYNGDGDVGTDADIEAFFRCLAGDCCPTCPPDSDFNCDGDVGTDSDIESFFRVLAGGAC